MNKEEFQEIRPILKLLVAAIVKAGTPQNSAHSCFVAAEEFIQITEQEMVHE